MVRFFILVSPFLSGCAAMTTGAVSGVSAGVGGLVGGPVGAAAGAAVGASATSLMTSGVSGASCPTAVTGFWPLMGQVIQTGGWLLAGIVIIPLIMGYLIPNGLVKQKKT
jgi:hypothetical protein